MTKGAEALERLRAGNKRFVANVRSAESISSAARRAELAVAQQPFAIVLGCSDSRVPVEIIFDQGLGDLFVIRVAGNIVAPSLIGSVEFAASQFGTRLVVVLGHSQCGAILATLVELRRPTANQSPNLKSIVDRIRPAVEGLLAGGDQQDQPGLVSRAVEANILASVQQLRHGSAIIEGLVANHGLVIVGASYSLDTGVVEFLEQTL
ncbi:MAG: carbonic anhydrase [Gammaproteobacteria bacterium]|nr:carbonic anhydrase [Gammaproteobacteria bacterium]